MTTFDDLATTALLGTDRRSVDVIALPAAASDVTRRLASTDAATALLDAAAVMTAYRRGGQLAGPAASVPEPAAPETAPIVPSAATARLERILADKDSELLREWLSAATSGGWIVAPRALPRLLAAAASDRGVGAAAAAALGRRGRWLAGFHPDWSKVLTAQAGALEPQDSTDEQTWQLADPAARRSLLTALRRTDPEAARELLAGTWSQEKADDRASFVRLLGIGLSAADELFLEAALDDRGKEVRAAAARLLQALPTSALGTRMAARAAASVTAERRLLRTRLVVTPPSECDEAMVRDGIDPRPPHASTGEKAWWLQQIVAAAPLETWTRLLRTDPAGVLETPVEGTWRDNLVEGWTAAATAQRNSAWAAALVPAVPTNRQAQLLALLPTAERSQVVAAMFRAPRDAAAEAALAGVLATTPGPWQAPLTDAVLGWLARPGVDYVPWQHKTRLTLLGHRLPPAAAAAVAAAAAGHPDDSPWRSAIAGVADLLTFRHQMLEELR